jgi:predicted metalloprotease with PDZ domain
MAPYRGDVLVTRFYCFAILFAPALAAQEPIQYELSFPNANHHEAEVRATFSGISKSVLELVMSRSSPGRYALHNFAKSMYNVQASDENGRLLQVTRSATNQWDVSGHRGTVVFHYTLYGDTIDGTYNAFDLTHAHLNSPATFVWARGMEQRPVRVKLEAPLGLEWKVATQMRDAGDGWWSAPSRDMLMDSPIEFSAHKVREWSGGGAQFRIALHSDADDQAATELARFCEAVTIEEEGVFGAFPRFDNGMYTFLLDYRPYANNDGMEHRDSTSISQSTDPHSRKYGESIYAIAHEFFHAWNVERIRPRSLEPFDFERENMSNELWFAEGVTNYYGPLISVRAGITNLDQFAANLTDAVNALVTSPARNNIYDATALSGLAPFYDDGAPPDEISNTFTSYYYIGQALASSLDLTIRGRYPGKSLDDWMRLMWHEHPDIDKPYKQDDLERILAKMTGNSEFASDIFTRYIRGHEVPDYRSLLAQAGFLLRKRIPGHVWFGVLSVNVSDIGISINGPAFVGSPAYDAGLDRGDRIVLIDGRPVKELKDWERLVGSHKPGEYSMLRVQGRAGERIVKLVWQEAPQVEIVPFEKAGMPLSIEARGFRNAWLGSKAMRPLPKLP